MWLGVLWLGGLWVTHPQTSFVMDVANPTGIALLGVTASGKSAIAHELALRHSEVEIVSVDSMCVYRGMDIGTAKPTRQEQNEVRYHLLDLVDPWEEFTVSQFQSVAKGAISEILGRGHLPLLVGGTGLYLRSIIDDLKLPGRWPHIAAQLEAVADADGALDEESKGSSGRGLGYLYSLLSELDPIAAERITPNNSRRIVRALEVTIGSGRAFSSFGPGLGAYPPTSYQLIGLTWDPVIADARIEERMQILLERGFLDEVSNLLSNSAGISKTARQALGYRELLAHIEQGVALDDCISQAVQRTRSFARRQWAWFRRDPRIHWISPEVDPVEELENAVKAYMGSSQPAKL